MMKFNGTPKQNAWAERIVAEANLTDEQIDALLWYAGPTLAAAGVCDARIVIDHRSDLLGYADSLLRLRAMTPAGRHAVATEACDAVRAKAAKSL